MRLSKQQIYENWNSDCIKKRRLMLISAGIMIAALLFCLCIKYDQYDHHGWFFPKSYYQSYMRRIHIVMHNLFQGKTGHKIALTPGNIDGSSWAGSSTRLISTIMAAVSGAGLAVGGAVFQTIYRNPMASPNMLGATAGVQLGNVVLVTMYSQSVLSFVTLRYQWCYALTAVCVSCILLLGRLAGDKKGNPSILKMLMAGSIINQGLGTISMYLMYCLDDEDLLLFQQISMGTYIDISPVSLIIFFLIMLVSLIPMFLFRFRLSVIGLDDSEARVAGINPTPYRLIAQICGVLMTTAALIHCGLAGMLAMVIPYIVRNRVGSEYRMLFLISAFFGATVLMICRTISTCMAFYDENGQVITDAAANVLTLPVTFFVNICLLPFFMIILARQRSAFE